MNKNVVNYELEELEQNLNANKITIPDIFLEEFLNNITIEKIKLLYQKLKLYEIKGYVNYDKYFESMKETFDEPLNDKMNNLYQEKKLKNIFF